MIPSWAGPIVLIVVLAAIVVGALLTRKPRAAAPQPSTETDADPAAALFSNGNRPTEDDISQARLGGTRGTPQLPDAPLVPQVKENTLPPVDPGQAV